MGPHKEIANLTADSDCDKLLKDEGLPMKKNDCQGFVGVNKRKNIYINQCMINKTFSEKIKFLFLKKY